MKKILISLLVLMMLCMSLPALAEGGEAITLELNTARLPYYAPDDPSLAGLVAEGNTLPRAADSGAAENGPEQKSRPVRG